MSQVLRKYQPVVGHFLSLLLVGATVVSADDLSERAELETVELHDFLADWFTGRLPQTQEAFARFDDAIAQDFVIVSPNGSVAERSSIVGAVYDDWGRWKGDDSAAIEVKNARFRHRGKGLSVVTYEEWQTTKNGTVVRLSSVVLRNNKKAPLGVEWVHLHETWMPQD